MRSSRQGCLHILLGQSWQYDNGVTYKTRDNVVIFRWGDRKIAMAGVISFEESIDKKRNNCNRTMTVPVQQSAILEKPSEKNDILPNKVEDKVILESQRETCTYPKDSATDSELVIKEAKGDIVEDIPEPPKQLSQEVEKDNSKEVVSIFQSHKSSGPNQNSCR